MPSKIDPSFQASKQTVINLLTKSIKKTKKQVIQREDILLNCRAWKSVQHEGQLIQANVSRIQKRMAEISVEDWEQEGKNRSIALDTKLHPKDQAIKFFKRSRKLRLGVTHAEKQLQLFRDKLSRQEEQLLALESMTLPDELEQFCKDTQLQTLRPQMESKAQMSDGNPSSLLPYRAYTSETGFRIWVGKSAKNNDKMTFHYANGSDLWLHARDYPGSHVILRSVKLKDVDFETLCDAAELALRFSKNKLKTEGEVTVSQVKYIIRIKNLPGKVQLSKHKIMRIQLENSRWERLRQSSSLKR